MTKNEVLKLFEAHKGEIISGEEVATGLGMSRTAIWKAINALREEGYDIESIRKKGYRLNPNSDILSIVKISEHLGTSNVLGNLEVHKSIDSTNKRLKLLALEGAPSWSVVASEQQTAGKAREKKEFLSPEGKGVYMSVLLRPVVKWEQKGELIGLIQEAVGQVLENICGREVTVSYLGDVCIDGKKVAGILTEMSVEAESEWIESIVVGIGINIYDKRETQIEHGIQIALSDITGDYCNRSEVIADMIKCLEYKINGERMFMK
ncbi:MAG: biotin--[acetyl-CoA-carboxylase] ligase [Cellulosilyticaceae bacterium]